MCRPWEINWKIKQNYIHLLDDRQETLLYCCSWPSVARQFLSFPLQFPESTTKLLLPPWRCWFIKVKHFAADWISIHIPKHIQWLSRGNGEEVQCDESCFYWLSICFLQDHILCWNYCMSVVKTGQNSATQTFLMYVVYFQKSKYRVIVPPGLRLCFSRYHTGYPHHVNCLFRTLNRNKYKLY